MILPAATLLEHQLAACLESVKKEQEILRKALRTPSIAIALWSLGRIERARGFAEAVLGQIEDQRCLDTRRLEYLRTKLDKIDRAIDFFGAELLEAVQAGDVQRINEAKGARRC